MADQSTNSAQTAESDKGYWQANLRLIVISLIIWAHAVGVKQALIYGFAKFIFKIVIAAIDTIFIYWARRSFLRHKPLMEN